MTGELESAVNIFYNQLESQRSIKIKRRVKTGAITLIALGLISYFTSLGIRHSKTGEVKPTYEKGNVYLKESTAESNWGKIPVTAIYYSKEGKEKFVAQGKNIKNASLSPDGKRVVYEYDNPLTGTHEIGVITATGEYATTVVEGDYHSPKWKDDNTIELKDKNGLVRKVAAEDNQR